MASVIAPFWTLRACHRLVCDLREHLAHSRDFVRLVERPCLSAEH
jgi:hypothetical protein